MGKLTLHHVAQPKDGWSRGQKSRRGWKKLGECTDSLPEKLKMRSTRGFTLIELLIVVAIIAILAAIAVPNFLEAQTRAKVSRVKADMRSLATALEAYHVDRNFYPPDGNDLQMGNPFPPALDYNCATRLRPLTTPISYITSLPPDVFDTKFKGMPPADMPDSFFFQGGPPFTFIYLNLGSYFGSNVFPIEPANGGNPDNYTLLSFGPDQAFSSSLGTLEYDPTNGTVSLGDVIRRGGERVTQ